MLRSSNVPAAALVLLAASLLAAHPAEAGLLVDGVPIDESALASGVAPGTIVTGAGLLAGSSDPQQPWDMNGAVIGSSLDAPITITGHVGGSGSYDNVAFAGTLSPGHSPALVTVGSVIYTASNTLVMELGGLLPGSQHDKIVHNGLSLAGGTLQVTLINAFVPAAGNVFDIFDWNAGVSGTFASVVLPPLNVGLVWNTSDLYAGGTISVTAVPEASAALFCSIAAGAASWFGCSRLRRRGDAT